MPAGGPVRRVAEAVGGSIDSAAGLPDFQRELLQHMRSMDHGMTCDQRSLNPRRAITLCWTAKIMSSPQLTAIANARLPASGLSRRLGICGQPPTKAMA